MLLYKNLSKLKIERFRCYRGKLLESMDQWLVRTSENIIAGPYSTEQIKNLIRERKLCHQDEICQGNSYWFYLYEQNEVHKQLGLTMPKNPALDPDDEETQTDTKVVETVPIESDLSVPDLNLDSTDGSTTVMSSKNFKEVLTQKSAQESEKKADQPIKIYEPVIFKGIESTSLWKAVVIILILLVVILLVTLIQLTRD